MGKKLKKQPKIKPINNFLLMAFLSVFQLVTGFIGAMVDGEFEIKVLLSSVIFLVVEWIYLFVFYYGFHRRNFELEIIAFFLTGVGLVAV